MHLALGEHAVKAGQGLRRAGEDDEAADGAVETVDDAEEDLAGLLVFLLQVGLDGLAERCVARLVALYNLAALLGDDDDVVVFVDDFHECKGTK